MPTEDPREQEEEIWLLVSFSFEPKEQTEIFVGVGFGGEAAFNDAFQKACRWWNFDPTRDDMDWFTNISTVEIPAEVTDRL